MIPRKEHTLDRRELAAVVALLEAASVERRIAGTRNEGRHGRSESCVFYLFP